MAVDFSPPKWHQKPFLRIRSYIRTSVSCHELVGANISKLKHTASTSACQKVLAIGAPSAMFKYVSVRRQMRKKLALFHPIILLFPDSISISRSLDINTLVPFPFRFKQAYTSDHENVSLGNTVRDHSSSCSPRMESFFHLQKIESIEYVPNWLYWCRNNRTCQEP